MVDKNVNFYEILAVDRSATQKQILTAYRKQALKCHPDKNPDNPQAAERFHQLSKALEVLCDVEAKAAYDKVLDGRAKAEARHHELNSQRKKFKEDLEAREKAAADKQTEQSFRSKEISAEERLRKEIDRLREEGSAILKAEQEKIREEIHRDINTHTHTDTYTHTDSDSNDVSSYKLRIKWKCMKSEEGNGGYTHEKLERLFSKYGVLNALVVSSKKKGTALADFSTYASALSAISETGDPERPLTVDWITSHPTPLPSQSNTTPYTSQTSHHLSHSKPAHIHAQRTGGGGGGRGADDFESLVLMRMRDMQQRVRDAAQQEKQQQQQQQQQECTENEDDVL